MGRGKRKQEVGAGGLKAQNRELLRGLSVKNNDSVHGACSACMVVLYSSPNFIAIHLTLFCRLGPK